MNQDTERRYNLTELEERIREEIKECRESRNDPEEYSMKIADSVTPVYFADCYQLCNDYPEIGNMPIESGLIEGDNMYPAKVCQIGIYEWISCKLREILEEDSES